ncbi:MAG: cell wall-binding repeat-containing protein [Bifidobacterium catenulatum]
MRRNLGFSRALGVVIAGCLLVSGSIASPANAAEDVKKSVQSQKIMDERPAVLDENTPSTFSERSNEPVSSVTGVTLGDGYKARTDYISIDQRNTKRDALNAVIKWRKDALNDARIKFKYDGSWKTVPEYLKAAGISQQEYLSPKWSNALERIAIQRALEAYTWADGHTRPDDDWCFEASYKGLTSNAEVLAWGTWDISDAIDLWASEKSDYINEVNGHGSGMTGHYTTLTYPDYGSYGFAGGFSDSSTYSGEAVPRGYASKYSDETPTNLKGYGRFEISVSQGHINDGMTWKGLHWNSSSALEPGKSDEAVVRLSYDANRYNLLGGTWSSSNTVVATVNEGNIKTLKRGNTVIKVNAGGRLAQGNVRVAPAMQRISGATRYDTMSQVVQKEGLKQGQTVIVASGANYPDALASSSLAGALDATIVLTDPQSLYKAGEQLGAKWGAIALLMTGDNYADALSISSYAYMSHMPIFLCSSTKGFTDGEIKEIKKIKKMWVIGGEQAVPQRFFERQIAGGMDERIAGSTRYETSINVADRFAGDYDGFLRMNNVVFTTGMNFPDALATGPFAGRNKAVLLLADPNGSTANFVKQYVKQHGDVDNAYIVGGENAVSRNTANGLADALDMLRP